jgi:hypothetical protein
MPDENGNLLPEDEGYVAPETIIEESPEVVEEPIAEPDEDVYNTELKADPELYTVQAADLNTYPELSQQGVQLHNQVKYGSLYVWKKATASGDGVVQYPWPRSTGNEKSKGITLKENNHGKIKQASGV